jgi:Histidine kinase
MSTVSSRFGRWRDLHLTMRSLLIILTFYWMYVAFSNVLYANSMQKTLSEMSGGHMFFAPWNARLLQHLFLYPVLLGSVWASLRTGWQPLRRVPVQLLLALVFSMLGQPALSLGEQLLNVPHAMARPGWSAVTSTWAVIWGDLDFPVWTASTVSFLLTYGFGLALINGIALYQRFRDAQLRSADLERALTDAHLAALRMQLSPHTLFNLLHTIRGHISWDPAVAQSMVVQLGDLLRRLLSAGEREFSRLTDELQFVRLYLELQQKRFADRLTVRVADVENLPAAWVPSLILQPLVENAVVHGLARHTGPVEVRVEASIQGETLVLRVVNTIAADAVVGRESIGLRNVRDRLALQFAGAASFTAAVAGDSRWVAEVRLPLLREGPQARRSAVAQAAQAQIRSPTSGSHVVSP